MGFGMTRGWASVFMEASKFPIDVYALASPPPLIPDHLCYNRSDLFLSSAITRARETVAASRLRPRLPQASLSMTEVPQNPIKGRAGSADPSRFTAAQDESLLERIRARDHKAMTDLFDRYSRLVYSVALRVLKDPGQAEDIMQDVFFNLWQSPGSFISARGSLGAWLLVVARNRAIDSLRRRKPSDPVDEVVLPAKTNLASDAERNTIMEKVRGVMNGLPPDQQTSLQLAFFEGLSHSEIAAQTGDPLGTVKTRIRTALISVRKAIQA